MVALAAGSVVLVPFPFSDLSRSKLRPAVALAAAGKLFTAHHQLVVRDVGILTPSTLTKLVESVVKLLRA